MENEMEKEELAADGTPAGVEEYIPCNPYPFDTKKVSISTKKQVLSNIVKRIERGTINTAEVQRSEDLWDIGKKSRLIESLMLRIPIPMFYAAIDKDDKMYIVDGLQRISTIKHYLLKESFQLKGLEFLTDYENKIFEELPEEMQTRIEETELDFVIINPESPPEIQRNIFKRLNTGGLPLTDQEIRNALYCGFATKLLKEITESEEFNQAVKVNDSRKAAQELVLRFFAFSIFGNEEYKKDFEMDSFLSDAMLAINELENNKSLEKINKRNIKNRDINQLKIMFLNSMVRAVKVFGDHAFRRSLQGKKNPVNKALFEVWSVVLSKYNDKEYDLLIKNKKSLFEKLEKLYNEPNFDLIIGKRRDFAYGVKDRFKSIDGILDSVIFENKENLV